jgi:rare lipoprotein A
MPNGVRGMRGLGLSLALVLSGGCALVARPVPPASPAGGGAPSGAVRPAPTVPDDAGVPGAPDAVAPGWVQEGPASWYGEPFHGRQTASGEVYDMEAATAAHRTLPFGALVQIENLETGAVTTLRINDRGPFVGNRILDVSRRGARELGLIGPGVARVRVRVVEVPEPRSCWEVQVGAWRERTSAEAARARLEADGTPARLVAGSDGLHRVRAGPWSVRAQARAVADREGGVLLPC